MESYIGRILGNRYEILEKIGDGGMALVFKGRCRLLNRFVAIKMLKREFITNDEFVSKFEKEAQASAGLSHPNIVNIYDVGKDGDTHYIVMEYVDGMTLKEFIQSRKSDLTEFQIVSISKQIAEALSSAHRNHIIHRDIKPHNILVTENMTVKVADFGIARALTSATLTATKEIMGSVHYASPEQARGTFVDERSDIYSLGVVMYEMATGVIPFDGDTPVTVALKHMNDDIVPPSDYNPNISIGLESIIYKALMKSPLDRFESSKDMAKDLGAILINPDTQFDYFDAHMGSDAPTMIMPDPSIYDDEYNDQEGAYYSKPGQDYDMADDDLGATGPFAGVRDRGDVFEDRSLDEMDTAKASAVNGFLSTSNGKADEASEKGKKKKKPPKSGSAGRKTVVASVAIGIFAAMVIFAVAIKLFFGGGFIGADTVSVPDVENINYNVAKEKLEKAGLKVGKSDEEFNDSVPIDFIISQSVKAGEKLKKGEVVNLVVSKGGEGNEDGTKVPDVANKSYDEAKLIITNAGYVVGTVEYVKSDLPSGQIVEQFPAGGSDAAAGSSVNLNVSQGKTADVVVPSLVGKTLKSARAVLNPMKLSIGDVTLNYSDTYSEGTIMLQAVKPGSTVNENSSIDVVVSKGKEQKKITDPGTGSQSGSAVTSKNFVVPLNYDKDTFVVKVVKTVNGVDQTVYEKQHSKTEGNVTVTISGSGPATIKFYFDGTLVSTQNENF